MACPCEKLKEAEHKVEALERAFKTAYEDSGLRGVKCFVCVNRHDSDNDCCGCDGVHKWQFDYNGFGDDHFRDATKMMEQEGRP